LFIKSDYNTVMKYLKNPNVGETRGNFRNLTGNQYGDLTVVKRLGTDKQRHSYWLCKCVCGESVNILATNLKGAYKNYQCKHKPIPQQLDLFE
jgi:hypothetical protein